MKIGASYWMFEGGLEAEKPITEAMDLHPGKNHRPPALVEHHRSFGDTLLQYRSVGQLGQALVAMFVRSNNVNHIRRQFDIPRPLITLNGVNHPIDVLIGGKLDFLIPS